MSKQPAKRPAIRTPAREGKKTVSIYVTQEAWKQLRQLSLDLETPNQSLGLEAFNLLFKKHGLDQIA